MQKERAVRQQRFTEKAGVGWCAECNALSTSATRLRGRAEGRGELSRNTPESVPLINRHEPAGGERRRVGQVRAHAPRPPSRY